MNENKMRYFYITTFLQEHHEGGINTHVVSSTLGYEGMPPEKAILQTFMYKMAQKNPTLKTNRISNYHVMGLTEMTREDAMTFSGESFDEFEDIEEEPNK